MIGRILSRRWPAHRSDCTPLLFPPSTTSQADHRRVRRARVLSGLRTSGACLAIALVCSGVATIASPSGASPASSGGWGAPTMIDPG
ncbi:MAG: hypothetical protein ACRDXC_14835 [Acidimicrobiales bacterium]